MSNPKKPNLIKKKDYARVVVTETLPFETPIIFSNDGLYKNIVGFESHGNVYKRFVEALVFSTGTFKAPKSTIPFSYKIRKNSLEKRKLALLHPVAQWKFQEFYKTYEKLIIHLCTRSSASLRAPQKVAGTFYTKRTWENIHQYKTGKVAEIATDRYAKHSPSFFSYKGFDRLYKFFDSVDFFELEKSFQTLWTLDVSKCFDSIYTHSLSWAVKDKEFTKKHVAVRSTFSQQFDRLMQHSNHSETNGIVIGPEVSRVFAEIIFQSVDVRTVSRLEGKFEYGKDYEIRRYVDDVFIFAHNHADAESIFKCYADVLQQFNLHANAAKTQRMNRPFMTNKSRIIREASASANAFFDLFLEAGNDSTSLKPKAIHYSWRLTRSFINTVRAICSQNQAAYDELSSYLLSVFTERVKKLANISLKSPSEELLGQYRDACLVLLDVIYFLYRVGPTVAASYKLCTAIIVLARFSKKNLGAYHETIKQRVYELSAAFLSSEQVSSESGVEGFVSLEAINIVMALRELGDKYLLPATMVERLFVGDNRGSYWGIVAGLFYIQKNAAYSKTRHRIIKAADKKLHNLSDVLMHTEKACLFLDLLCCPYVDQKQKMLWAKRFFQDLKQPVPLAKDLTAMFKEAGASYWFINWSEVDLLNSLEKKELKQAY